MFNYRPTPIQLSWLNPTDHPAIDWLIIDQQIASVNIRIIPGMERLWRLPDSALSFRLLSQEKEAIPEIQHGASDEASIFGCFNNLVKLNDALIAYWSACLAVVRPVGKHY